MEPADLLRHACDVCERLQLTYLITGSTATIAYGEPRFTNDIDIVIELPPGKIVAFCNGFLPPDFYCSLPAIQDAVRLGHQFNILHPASGLKIDFIVLTDSEFDQSRRQRVRKMDVLPDRPVAFASPEDVIIKKMVYFQEGGSDKHLHDIAGVLRIQGKALDLGYIDTWATKLGLSKIWKEILEQE
jgi:hypothetical protein